MPAFFSKPWKLINSCVRILCCTDAAIIIIFLLTATLSSQLLLMANHRVQAWPMCLRDPSSRVAVVISFVVMQSGMSMHESIVLIVIYMHGISLLCLHNQSMTESLYGFLLLYWHIHSNILCSLCDRIAMSLLNIATCGLQSVIKLTSQAKE